MTIMIRTVTRVTGHAVPNSARATIVASAVAVSSQDSRSSRRRFVYRARSAMITASAGAPRRSSRTNSSTRAFETRERAESTQAMSPPSGTRQMAMISATTSEPLMRGDSPTAARGVADLATGARQRRPDGPALGDPRPLLHQPGLELEHLPLLIRLAVVVAEEVQDAVRAEQVQLGLGGVPGRRRLVGGDGRAENDVAEHRRAGVLVGPGRGGPVEPLRRAVVRVHREGHHVRRPGE